MTDFFISYTEADESWAKWIAGILDAEGFTTKLQVRDFPPGSNFVLDMDRAVIEADTTIAVLSPDYLNSAFASDEWTAAFVKRTLLPVRVRECEPTGLLATITYVDLVGCDKKTAENALLNGIKHNREEIKPTTKPSFPGRDKPHFPGVDYGKYLRCIQDKYMDEDRYGEFVELRLKPYSRDRSPSNSSEESLELTLKEILSTRHAVQVLGKPGSGKTSLLKRFLLALASNYPDEDLPFIPILVEYRGNDLFSQILHHFTTHELTEIPSSLSPEWLQDELNTGKFVILVDDVHNILSDDHKRVESRIDDLLDFRQNRFILMSRDYYTHSPFHLELFEIAPLNDEEIQGILHIHGDEREAGFIFQSIRWDKTLRELYSTPQRLMLLSKVYTREDRILENKSELFKSSFKLRHDEEERKTTESLPYIFKEEILSGLAFRAFADVETPYSIPERECLKILTSEVEEAKALLGYDARSTENVLNSLCREGYLIRHDHVVKFEHDQWQEFFAAREILNNRLGLGDLPAGNTGEEVVYFLSGFYSPEESKQHRDYWSSFWGDLVNTDFFLVQKCLDSRGSETADKWLKPYKGITFTKDEVKEAYAELLHWYRKIIEDHFPALIEKFAPRTSGPVGVLVEMNDTNVEFWYGYRRLNPQTEESVIVTNQEEIARLNPYQDRDRNSTYYQKHFGIPYTDQHAWLSSTALHEPPVTMAFRDVRTQLSEFVRKGELRETPEMLQEKLYHEAIVLSKKLTGKDRPFDTGEVFLLQVGDLLLGSQHLKTQRYSKIEVSGTTYEFRGLPDRKVEASDFEARLLEYTRDNSMRYGDMLKTPLSQLLEVCNRYRLENQELSDDDREFLIDQSPEFFGKVYANYKEVIECNFPTAKSSFATYRRLPLRIFLVRKTSKNKKSFGARYVYGNVETQSEDVVVEIVSENEFSEIEKKYQPHGWFMGYWGLNSFERREPIRNAMYSLIYEELKALLGHTL